MGSRMRRSRRNQQVQADAQKVIQRLQAQINRSGAPSSPAVVLVQQRLAGLRSLVGLPDPSVSVLNRAGVPGAPDAKSTKLVILATGLAGLLLGFGVALLLRLPRGEDSRRGGASLRTRVPVLARVPRLTPWLAREVLRPAPNLPPASWESYRTLRTNLLRSMVPGETPVILVTRRCRAKEESLQRHRPWRSPCRSELARSARRRGFPQADGRRVSSV